MPFFDDSGARPEQERSAVWRSFALIKDQLERLILINLLWALQAVPLLVALVFELPFALRVALSAYSALVLAPATATLFAVVADLSEGVPLDAAMLWGHFKEQIKPGFLKLLPLLSLFYWLALLAGYASGRGWLAVDVLAQLVFLLLLVLSLSWGPLLVCEPQLQAWGILSRSVQRLLKFPGRTLLLGLVCLLALALGIVSIAGLMLIVPVLIALFQVQFYLFGHPQPGPAGVSQPLSHPRK